ncbi:MAG: hydrogenase maturation protease [Streptosporangiaceae bacterium]
MVIGVGNPFRRDDGIGPAVAAAIERQHLPGVRVVISDGEPSGLIEAWSGAGLAVIVDALHGGPAGRAPCPGRIHRLTPGGLDARPGPAGASAGSGAGSSHGLGLPDAFRLGHVLGRQPRRAVVLAVEAADVRPGPGLSTAVAAALPDVVAAVAAELRGARDSDIP